MTKNASNDIPLLSLRGAEGDEAISAGLGLPRTFQVFAMTTEAMPGNNTPQVLTFYL
jgi:hypothetical protein